MVTCSAAQCYMLETLSIPQYAISVKICWVQAISREGQRVEGSYGTLNDYTHCSRKG